MPNTDAPSKAKRKSRKLACDMSLPELEKESVRCKRSLDNKKLLPQSVVFYRRRHQLLQAEIARREPAKADR